jgi:hypothetical protein
VHVEYLSTAGLPNHIRPEVRITTASTRTQGWSAFFRPALLSRLHRAILNSNARRPWVGYAQAVSQHKNLMSDSEAQAIEHVVIRQQSYVAGTRERPEVRVFVETNRRTQPHKNKLAPGQTV